MFISDNSVKFSTNSFFLHLREFLEFCDIPGGGQTTRYFAQRNRHFSVNFEEKKKKFFFE